MRSKGNNEVVCGLMQETWVMRWKNKNWKQNVETSHAEQRNDDRMALKMEKDLKRPFSEVT